MGQGLSVPRTSVLMVAYNAAPFLTEAVDSLLCQCDSDFELILVDNASTDGSVIELAKNCHDKRLRVVSAPENLGPYGGAVAGLSYCRGEFIARMDADDASLPQRLSLQVGALQAQPRLDALGCFCQRIDEQGADLGEMVFPCTHEDIVKIARLRMPIAHPTLVMRRSVLEQTPYRQEYRSSGDFDFVLRALDRFRFATLPLSLYQYRQQPRSLTQASNILQLASGCAARLVAVRRARQLPEHLETEIAWATELASRLQSRAAIYDAYAQRAAEMSMQVLALQFKRQARWEEPGLRRLPGIGNYALRAYRQQQLDASDVSGAFGAWMSKIMLRRRSDD